MPQKTDSGTIPVVGSKPKRSWKRTPPPEHTPSTQDWVEIARRTLISEGIVEVKIDRLAKMAGVTRGGFYWRFANRDELLQALIEDWRDRNTSPLVRVLKGEGSPRERMYALARLYIDERDFSPEYDSAVRAWASLSPEIAEIVREVDDVRISVLTDLFLEAGFAADEAQVRARITYFHQVGYYAIAMQEPAEQRLRRIDLSMQVLLGSL